MGDYDDRGSDGFMDWSTHWYLLRCCGCDHVFAQTVSSNSEDYDNNYDEHGEPATEYRETIAYFPALTKRTVPDWIHTVRVEGRDESVLVSVLKELYGALANDQHILASIGIRTAFDGASELLGIDPAKSFAAKLDALVEGAHIGKVDRERLEVLVDAGSASAHRGWKPSLDDIDTLMELLEHFIQEGIVGPEKKRRLDEKAAAMKENVPARKQSR